MEETNKQTNENTTRWYAVYTTVRAEGKVKKQLEQIGYDSYMPLQYVIRAWGSRKKKIELPVVPGFIFVCLSEDDVAKVTALPDVSFLLKREGEYVSESDKRLCVEVLKKTIENR